MAIDTMFQPQGGGGGSSSSGQYVQDNFLDTSLPATQNSGFSSTALSNPLSFFFGNTDTPTFSYKTHFIKDLVLIEDRSKWVNNKQTFEIIFNDTAPGIRAYVCGTPRIRSLPQGKSLEVRETGDFIGITGNIRQLAWLLNTTTQVGTCLRSTDSVVGTNLTFGSSAITAEANGVNTYLALLHQTANTTFETNELHDFRIEANQFQTLRFVGALTLQNASNIDVRPGSTYVNKTLLSTVVGASFAVPGVSAMGAASSIVKVADGYTLATTNTPFIGTVATGFSGTNLISVAVGTGASFPQGCGVIAGSGANTYLGVVSSQSTDTLTVSPTLAFGLSSNTLYRAWQGIPTLAVNASLLTLRRSIDFSTQNNLIDSIGFNVGSSALFGHSDPELRYRLWGADLRISTVDQVTGLALGASSFLQFDGECAAAELEFHAQGILHATMAVNGIANWSINTGFTGSFKRTVFTDGGPSWNSFNIAPGSSFANVVLTKINLYDRQTTGVSFGVLGTFPTYINTVERAASNATIMPIGSFQRTYADSLYLTGAWTRGVSSSFAGNVSYFGASTNCVLNFNYFGSKFGFVGSAGGSMAATVDGASIGFDFNVLKGPTVVGWHNVTLQYQAGATAALAAFDYLKPQPGEIDNKQNYVPLAALDNLPSVFTTQYTPQKTKDGDLWIQKKSNAVLSPPLVWLRLFGMWNQISFLQSKDDPNAAFVYKSHGSSTSGGAAAGGQQDIEQFNGAAWVSASASSLGARTGCSAGDMAYTGGHHAIDGLNTAGAVTQTHQRFFGSAWTSLTNTGAGGKAQNSGSQFNGFLYQNKGSTTTAAAQATTDAQKWNGTAWTTATAWAFSRVGSGSFRVGALLGCPGGFDASGTAQNTVETKTATDVNATTTNQPVIGYSSGGASINEGGIVFSMGQSNSITTFVLTGATWSASITTYSCDVARARASNFGPGMACKFGGDTGGAVFTSFELFNGISATASTASSLARSAVSGSYA